MNHMEVREVAQKTAFFTIKTVRKHTMLRLVLALANSGLSADCFPVYLCNVISFCTEITAVRAEGRHEQWLPSVSLKHKVLTRVHNLGLCKYQCSHFRVAVTHVNESTN